MSGLDPVGRREIRDLILGLKSKGKTVFLSSHILQDVEMICDRVGILSAGRILKIASVAEVLDRSVQSVEIHLEGLPVSAARNLGYAGASGLGEKAVINVAHQDEVNVAIMRLVAAGARVTAVIPLRTTLEDYFMSQIAGGGPEEGRAFNTQVRGLRSPETADRGELLSNAPGKMGR
jgi:ABC-2 type transport system ATP-binding protein